MNTFASRLRVVMADYELTQQDLSVKSGISQPTISRYLRGKNEPKIDDVVAIAKAIGVSASTLLGWDTSGERLRTQTSAASVLAELGDSEEDRQRLFNEFLSQFSETDQAMELATTAIERMRRAQKLIQMRLRGIFERRPSSVPDPDMEALLAAAEEAEFGSPQEHQRTPASEPPSVGVGGHRPGPSKPAKRTDERSGSDRGKREI